MKRKKLLWIFAFMIVIAALVFVVNSRKSLKTTVIFGGADSVFVDSDSLKKPLDDYGQKANSNAKYDNLDFPEVNIKDWNFILINSTHIIKNNTLYETYIEDTDETFDIEAEYRLEQMLDAAREAGFKPYIAKGYVSYVNQQKELNDEASRLSAGGELSYEQAYKNASKHIEMPGTSDHQTGLGVDITDKQYDGELDYSKMDKKFYEWMDANCAEYGFIKRYPSDKSGITGRDEPWHYRYVGGKAAEFIMENHLCLEEFINYYEYQIK